jgi:PAS domain S-box-containing protein
MFARSRVALTIALPGKHDCNLIHANDKFLQMAGYSLDQVVGRDCRFLQGERQQHPQTKADIRAALSSGTETTAHLRNVRADGREFDNLLYLNPLRDIRGGLLYFLGSQYDLSKHFGVGSEEEHASELAALIGTANVDLARSGLSIISALARVSAANATIARNQLYLSGALRPRHAASKSAG